MCESQSTIPNMGENNKCSKPPTSCDRFLGWVDHNLGCKGDHTSDVAMRCHGPKDRQPRIGSTWRWQPSPGDSKGAMGPQHRPPPLVIHSWNSNDSVQNLVHLQSWTGMGPVIRTCDSTWHDLFTGKSVSRPSPGNDAGDTNSLLKTRTPRNV